MPATTSQIRTALRRAGVEPHGRLRALKAARIVSDGTSVVVKLSDFEHSSYNYAADLKEYAKAGVPAEQLLVDEPLAIADQWALVVAYVRAVEPTTADHAETVGRLLRLTHDRVWPFREQQSGDLVYCPDDWRPENIIVGATEVVMVDLDLAGAW